ncbi:MAG: hypothetical protein AUK50_04490 [Comamonadaceae bacterium CG2_30_57_122]|nr:MAG: hypothetical protein AUK50_04490 [Comamonadaceae bacterium CG2_30_57_122]
MPIPQQLALVTLASCFSACKPSFKTPGQIGLLAPLFAPAGVQRGGGDKGGIQAPRRVTATTSCNSQRPSHYGQF